MSITSLLPIGGAALGVLASKAMAGFSDSLSFQALLHGGQETKPEKNPSAAVEKPVPLDLAQAIPQFVAKLRDRLQSVGVDLSSPLTLREDGNGSVTVDGGHPDQAAIEEAFLQDPQLLAAFQSIAAAASEQRQSLPLGLHGSQFEEFRLNLINGAASIGFE